MPRPLSILPALFEDRRPPQERPGWHLYHLRAHRTVLEWLVRRPLDNRALGSITQETQGLRQRGRRGLTGIAQKRLESLCGLLAPDAVCRSGPIVQCVQQALDLANRLGRRTTLVCRGWRSLGPGRPSARLAQLLRLRSFLRDHLGNQCITLGCGQVEPLPRLHVILREPYTLEIQPVQGRHSLGLASLRARSPLGYGHVPLASLVICPGRPRQA